MYFRRDKPPASLIYCRLLGDKNQTYNETCKICREHISCVRWIEKELIEKGFEINVSVFTPAQYWRERSYGKQK